MELKRVLENLRIKDDINNLSVSELTEKYGSSPEGYEVFLDTFSRIFVNRRLYPIIILSKYDKIDKFLRCNAEYDRGRTLELDHAIRENMRREKSVGYTKAEEDSEQAKYVFGDDLGVTCFRPFDKFENIIKNIRKTAEELEGVSLTDVSKEEYTNYLRSFHFISQNGKNEEMLRKVVDKYYEDHESMKFCYDPWFLVTANYFLSSGAFEKNDEFKSFVREVINISLDVAPISLKNISNEYSEKSYRKLAKKTLKKLAKLDEKEEDNTNVYGIRRKIKKIFNK